MAGFLSGKTADAKVAQESDTLCETLHSARVIIDGLPLVVAWSGHGLVCAECIDDSTSDAQALARLNARLPRCQFVAGQLSASDFARMPLHLVGTAFQRRVWRALLQVPAGHTCHYSDLAGALDSGARAVGSAVAQNPLALRVPCHRVVPRQGGTGEYRWGRALKAALLAAETRQAAA